MNFWSKQYSLLSLRYTGCPLKLEWWDQSSLCINICMQMNVFVLILVQFVHAPANMQILFIYVYYIVNMLICHVIVYWCISVKWHYLHTYVYVCIFINIYVYTLTYGMRRWWDELLLLLWLMAKWSRDKVAKTYLIDNTNANWNYNNRLQ